MALPIIFWQQIPQEYREQASGNKITTIIFDLLLILIITIIFIRL